ncbi:MAG: hypothetical protein GY856_29735 [bacterium]|nr:hypothetical protein [bacterium]
MKSRRRVLGAVLTLISLPLVVALVEAVSFHVRNRNNGSIVSSGEKREYLLYVPKSYDSTRPTPLVISMHGGGGWPVLQRDLSRWNRLADSHGFIVAYPSGLEVTGTRSWRVMRRGTGLTKDVRFISDLIDDLEKAYNIDPTRIYANGLSNGGGMAFVLSCTLSDRIAAVGMVAAAQMLPWSWCTDHRPVPMVAFHGTADSIVPYEGGTTLVFPDGSFPDVSQWTANWARRNRCGPDAVESAVAADVTRRDYTDCADDAAVVLFTIHGGGHTWPGGEPLPEWFLGATSRSVDATRQMWAFFQEHWLPRSPLLDTHAYLWWLSRHPGAPASASRGKDQRNSKSTPSAPRPRQSTVLCDGCGPTPMSALVSTRRRYRPSGKAENRYRPSASKRTVARKCRSSSGP